MKVIVRPKMPDVARLAALIIAETMQARQSPVLGLATGRTMQAVYAELVRLHRAQRIDFMDCTTFNLDEYIGIAPDDPRSFRQYMERHLFSQINILAQRTHVPMGSADDPSAEARRYDAKIGEAGGIDLQLLGIGRNGHIGFNEPLTSLTARTHDVTLSTETRQQNISDFADLTEVPDRAITMGTGTILEARQILVVVTGLSKASILAKALEGPLTASISCSALQMHQSCIVVADAEAASRLAGRSYYDRVVQHDSALAHLIATEH